MDTGIPKGMDVGMLHTHTLIVGLYLLQLLIKVILLAAGKHEQLDKFSRGLRIPHIVLSVLLLGTGVYLMFRSPLGMEPFIWVKILLLAASIPVGVIGFKRHNLGLAAFSFLLLVGAMGLAYAKPMFLRSAGGGKEVVTENDAYGAKLEAGKTVYVQKCKLCHGDDGSMGFQGAKNLQKSTLSDQEIHDLIRNGKGMMPADKDLSEEQVDQVIAYVKYLRM